MQPRLQKIFLGRDLSIQLMRAYRLRWRNIFKKVNEISMPMQQALKFGNEGSCKCGGGIGAVVPADVLVTAACSNWGCYAIVAAMAAREKYARLTA